MLPWMSLMSQSVSAPSLVSFTIIPLPQFDAAGMADQQTLSPDILEEQQGSKPVLDLPPLDVGVGPVWPPTTSSLPLLDVEHGFDARAHKKSATAFSEPGDANRDRISPLPPSLQQMKSKEVQLQQRRVKAAPQIYGASPTVSLVQRSVVVVRDADGYGLTVSGDHPVFVQTVKQGGAAWRVGVRQGDRILKVNGLPVDASNHLDVVRMITGGSQVVLSLLGRPPRSDETDEAGGIYEVIPEPPSSAPPTRPPSGGLIPQGKRPVSATCLPPHVEPKPTITRPVPVSSEKELEWRKKRVKIISQMVQEEQRHLEELKANRKQAGNVNLTEQKHVQADITQAQQRIRHLQSQIDVFAEESAAQQPGHPSTPPIQGEQSDTETSDMERMRTASSGARRTSPRLGGPRRSPPANQKTPVAMRVAVPPSGGKQATGSNSAAARQSAPPGALLVGQKEIAAKTLSTAGMHFVAAQQVDVVPMEESSDDEENEAVVPLDTQGPFSNLADLKTHPAHLAVFLHFLISNSDPASLLFFLITDLYQNASGNAKELRKWAYEIHSTFLVPTAPLQCSDSIELAACEQIDRVLAGATPTLLPFSMPTDQPTTAEGYLRRLFIQTRGRCLDDINEHMNEFRSKRIMGLGHIFGENMLQGLTPGDRGRELKVADALLTPHFEACFGSTADYDGLSTKAQALASGLATVIKHVIAYKPSCNLHDKLLDKCPTFVTKDKSAKFKLKSMASKKAVQVKGHQFMLQPVLATTFCYQCSEMIWGINIQGYFCSNCDMALHKQCTSQLTDACYPASQGTGNTKASLGVKRPTKPIPAQTIPKLGRESSAESVGSPPKIPAIATSIKEHGEDLSQEDLRQESLDRSTDLPNRDGSPASGSIGSDGDAAARLSTQHLGLTAANDRQVGRSQSMRTREEEQKRQAADQSQQSSSTLIGWRQQATGALFQSASGRRAKSDVDADERAIALAVHQGGKAHTRLLGASESASFLGDSASVDSSNSSIHSATLSTEEETKRILERVEKVAPENDSDLEFDTNIPQLDNCVDWQLMKRWQPKEKKRQEIINELLHTERTHVRNLKVLCRVFYTPLLVQQILPPDVVKYLFSNIEEVLEMHSALNDKLKKLQRNKDGLIEEVGEAMLSLFLGVNGNCGGDDTTISELSEEEAITIPNDRFSRAAATFCQHQQHALEVLKSRAKKDAPLSAFLQETQSNPLCSRLELKDMLPMEMQRLTKYPLLLETIAKYSTEPSEEYDRIKRCTQEAKAVLDAVNEAKRVAENTKRLEELQRRMDTTSFDKENHYLSRQYRGLDLRRYELIRDGTLTWRLGKTKTVDLHVVLLEEMLVLLARHSDGNRLVLRYHDTSLIKQEAKWCPLLRLTMVMPKHVAVDKKAFFLVYTSAVGPQIYELVAETASEKKTWFKLISDQVDIVKKRQGAEADPSGGLHDSGVSDASQEGEETGGGIDSATVQVSTHASLVNPASIHVAKPTVLERAQPVLTPLERLRRHDQNILKALTEKQQILAELLVVSAPPSSGAAPEGDAAGAVVVNPQKTASLEELNHLAEQLAGMDVQELKQNRREPREVVISAIVQANRLLESINDGMRLREKQAAGAGNGSSSPPCLLGPEAGVPAVPCFRLTGIAAPLMKHLTAVLQTLQQREEELTSCKRELQRYKDIPDGVSPPSTTSDSQPNTAPLENNSSNNSSTEQPPPPTTLAPPVPPTPVATPTTPSPTPSSSSNTGLKTASAKVSTTAKTVVIQSRSAQYDCEDGLISPNCLTITQPPVTLTMPPKPNATQKQPSEEGGDSEENKESSPEEEELKKKEKRLQKRQRNVGLAATSPTTE